MGETSLYLKRYAYLDHPLVKTPPPEALGLVVTIPCFNEPDLIATLNSLWKCDLPQSAVELIVVVNRSENASTEAIQQNEVTIAEAENWLKSKSDWPIGLHLVQVLLPVKHAGVGLARQIAMDEALRRFHAVDNERGVIVCLDADATVHPNYLTAIEHHFDQFLGATGCSIHYEHPFAELETEAKLGIIAYELFLRYYVSALRYAKIPHAFHTIGSSMAVRARVYEKQGGMNKRKAGEDFYFLHKIIPLGHFTELKSTCVVPSPRISNRVPFGTGKAMNNWLSGQKDLLHLYSPSIFQDLRWLPALLPGMYHQNRSAMAVEWNHAPASIRTFLEKEALLDELDAIKRHSKDLKAFHNRFYRWFDGFRTLKFVHYARDNFHPNVPLMDAIQWLLEGYYHNEAREQITPEEALLIIRRLDRQGPTWSDQVE